MATNIGGNLGQPQIAVTTIGNMQAGTGAAVTMPGHLPQQPPAQQQTVGTGINTPMEVESAVQSSVVSSAQVSGSSTAGLGNLQSVVGSGMGNAVTTSSVVTMSSHSPLTTALQSGNTNTQPSTNTIGTQILTRPRLQDLVREVDPTEQLDEEAEELLLQLADDFVESTVGAACLLAKHRRASTVDVKDVQLHLERNWNMWIPGFGTDELRPYKRAAVTEAHKQRLALIRKALKKY
ncbi:Transcription initiation factor TFIID subunit 12 [Cryptotermes secundus]|uniref:Transcription initiation factor TFIID subunit 12 n=1 Tax=Cryptotermes secundus TaxID=105785 RepID=A0A2J7QWA9_9NEOP|nr:transcription initiation factor TFIID subunit 12 isoform X2 [Cryptotermes secundus]PNF32865.1 Transcription initiation factor TFIID subunit 12 [Cryptotermes secundus]